MIDVIQEMLSYTFMQRAVIVGLLVSICAALLGVSLVLKRYSMIGDGLSHVGFAILTISTVLRIYFAFIYINSRSNNNSDNTFESWR